jgi:hypothetical protein
MGSVNDPFQPVVVEEEPVGAFASLTSRPALLATAAVESAIPSAATARFHGFGVDDQPLLSDVPGLLHELVPARTTVPLSTDQIGSSVVLLFEQGERRRPIVIGVIRPQRSAEDPHAAPAPPVSIQADGERFVVSAEQEIVLRCGDASITLTRAGKVLINGTYVLSRSSGYNKLKGAAVDIN